MTHARGRATGPLIDISVEIDNECRVLVMAFEDYR